MQWEKCEGLQNNLTRLKDLCYPQKHETKRLIGLKER